MLGRTRRQAQHLRAELRFTGEKGAEFEVFTRQHVRFPENFTVGLRYRSPSGASYRLLRANGLHPGGHTNHIEGDSFTGFHVHRATERYQRAGYVEDAYAEESGAYSSLPQAIQHVQVVASLVLPEGGDQPQLL